MPVLQLDIEQKYSADYISNRYWILATDIPDGLSKGLVIANLHRTLFTSGFVVSGIRVSTPLEGDNLFGTMPLNLPGTRSTSGSPMPPWNRFRVDFQHGFKRPLRKFLIAPQTGDISGDSFQSATIAYVNENYCVPIVGLEYVVDRSGALVESASLNPVVGMRQLRRGSKRKTTPII